MLKFQCLLFVLKLSYICYYIICMTAPLAQDLNKIKIPQHPFVNIIKLKTCAKFKQKVLNSMVVRARQSFQFFGEITWFLGNKEALP